MPDLESLIASWRRQMRAAGIQSPTPLDELESHLREEIARQIQAGATEPQAFAAAAAQIGRPDTLKSEFKKSTGPFGSLETTAVVCFRRALALLWLMLCSVQLVSGAVIIKTIYHGQYIRISTTIFGILVTQTGVILAWTLFSSLLHVCGLVASIRLFTGRGGARAILLLALWNLMLCLASANIIFHQMPVVGIAWTVLYPVTILALWPRQKAKTTLK